MPYCTHAVLGALVSLIAAAQGQSLERSLEEANQRAIVLQEQGRYKEAEAVLSAALKEAEKLSPGDPALPNTLNSLALVYHDLDRIAEAERLYRRAIEGFGDIYGTDSPMLTKPLQNLTSLYLDQGQHGKAQRLLRRLLTLRPEASGPDPCDSIRTLQLQALILEDTRRYRGAEALYRQALSIGANAPTDEARKSTSAVLNNLARLYTEIGRPREALQPLQRALEILEKLSGENHPNLVKPLANLAAVYTLLHRPAEAEPLFTRALAIEKTASGDQGQTYGVLLAHYAIVLRQMNRRSEAKEYERRAKEILATAAARAGVRWTVDMNDLTRRPGGH
jgi:tetratricopeptide (TPR) repeat protein